MNATWGNGPRVRVDTLKHGQRFLSMSNGYFTYERRDGALDGVHHVVGDDGKRTTFAGCAEVVKESNVVRFSVSCVNKSGDRVLAMPANQAHHFWDTREAAQDWLDACFQNTGEDRLASIWGEQSRGTFRVDPFDCYEHGEAKGIYVEAP